MLERQCLDERCTITDPGRAATERPGRPDGSRAAIQGDSERPGIEHCHCESPRRFSPLSNHPCPMVDAMNAHMGDGDRPPPYFPQPDDDLPSKPEGPMGPIGPWATGRVSYSPVSGMTGLRPVVDRYSVTRYSPAEWRAHNRTFFDQSTARINEARTIESIVRETNKKIYDQTDKNQLQNRDRLSDRAGVVYGWKAEIERALLELTDEIEVVEAERRRVKQSLSVLTVPESIAGEFLQLRSSRLEPDLVRDPVEDELVQEVALCSEIRQTLVESREKIEIQLTELKTVKSRLEFDYTDKKDAYATESDCVALTNDSPLIMTKPGAARVPAEQSTPAAYDNFTREALETSNTIRQKSVDLRSTLNAIFENSIKELRNQAVRVDVALGEKIHVTEQVCQQLELELVKCLSQLASTEDLIEELRGATKRVKDALKVAQTRLGYRLDRRNVESCRDVPQYGLIEEVKVLNENLATMASQLQQAEEAQAGLVKSRSHLEREIVVKKKSLYIDRDRGQSLRSFYPSAEALAGFV